ncbi:MAG: HAMP domain-containing protein, partial [Gaiellaceae bacterium]
MSFRTRLALVAAAAVALAVVVASFAVYFIVKGELYGSVDDSLRRSATLVQSVDPHQIPQFTSPRFRAIGGVTQVVGAGGATFPPERILPVPPQVSEVAKGKREEAVFNTHALGQHLRVLAVRYPAEGVAVEVARSLTDTDHALSRIKLFLFLIAGFGIAVAAALGLVVSRAALAPVRRLTQTAEEVSETRDLSRRIDVHGRDELSRLASTFNTMLATLEDSARAQRQLVSDASHELRTPLTLRRSELQLALRGERSPAELRTALTGALG